MQWINEAADAFEKSKTLLANATLLVYPRANLPSNILVDASDVAISAVLQQKHGDEWKPIALFPRKLYSTQQRYSTFDRELLAAYRAVNHFHFLIDGVKFTLLIDHRPLVAAFYSKNDQIISRRARQLSFSAEFTNDLRHVQEDQNVVADALSRIEINNITFSWEPLNYAEIAKEQRENEYIKVCLH